jgi:hypothetical protein
MPPRRYRCRLCGADHQPGTPCYLPPPAPPNPSAEDIFYEDMIAEVYDRATEL